MSDDLKFRDLSGLTRLLKSCLGVFVAIVMISLWSDWLEIELLQRLAAGTVVSEAEAAASDSRQTFMGVLYLLIFVVIGVMFLRWTYLSNRNAGSLGALGRKFTPGWAVAWYFVPVASLWKPYQALKETFKSSHPDFTQNWHQAPHPNILPGWWTLWVFQSLVGQVLFRFALRADTVDELLASSWITFVSDALDVPLGLAAIVVVAKLQEWQSEKYRRLASTPT